MSATHALPRPAQDRRGRPRPARAWPAWAPALPLAALCALGCTDPGGRVVEQTQHEPMIERSAASVAVLTNRQRLQRALERLDGLDATVHDDGRVRTGELVASQLREQLARTPEVHLEHLEAAGVALLSGVVTDAAELHRAEQPVIALRAWVTAELQGVGPRSNPSTSARSSRKAAREPNIEDVLRRLARSGVTVLVPQPNGRDKEYESEAFSDLLRNKWNWLGADVTELPEFIDRIASDTFRGFKPYRVRTAQGELALRAWIEQEVPVIRAELRRDASPAPSAPPTPDAAPPATSTVSTEPPPPSP